MATRLLQKVKKEPIKTSKESTLSMKKNIYSRTTKHMQSIFEEKQIGNTSILREHINSCVIQIGKYLEGKDHEKVLHLGNKTLELFKLFNQKDLNTSDVLSLKGSLFMLLCKSEMENNNYQEVIKNAPTLIYIAQKIDCIEFTIDVNNIIAQAYIMTKDYRNAAVLWQKNLKLGRNQTEKAFFYHEIGRCYYQMNEFSDARLFGLWSLTKAFAAMNNQWCLNAALLVAQSETLMGCKDEALKSFNEAEKYALRENKQDIIDFIKSQKDMFLEAVVIKSPKNTSTL